MPRYSPYENPAHLVYPELCNILVAPCRNWPAAKIEALFDSYNLSAEDAENFFGTLQDVGRIVTSAAPAIAPLAGAAIGGPTGALIGTEVGRIASNAPNQATDRSAPLKTQIAPGVQGKAPGLTGIGETPQTPQIPQPLPGASPTAAKIMQLIYNP